MSANARFQNFTMTLPSGGPVSVPDTWDFTANAETEIDLSELINNGWLDYIGGVYVDNSANTGTLTIKCQGTNQVIPIAAGQCGYVPLFMPSPPKAFVTSSANARVIFQWYNVPVFPIMFGNSAGGSSGGNGSTISRWSLGFDGTSQEIVPAGFASKYFIIQNPTGNDPIKINLEGGDATVHYFEILAGGSYENINGILNSITVAGTNGQSVDSFAGV